MSIGKAMVSIGLGCIATYLLVHGFRSDANGVFILMALVLVLAK